MPRKVARKRPTKKKTSNARPRREQSPAGEATPAAPPADSKTGSAGPAVDMSKLIDAIFSSLGPEPPTGSAKERDALIQQYVKAQIAKSSVASEYNILVLHDEGRMIRSDADSIYSAAASFSKKRPIMLVLYSTGGTIGSAYLIGKMCREYSNGKLTVVVPRQAKSAATLICCAADEIHMGSLSELGPIDPQIDDLPALGLKTSVEHIADLTKEHPHAADMFAKYLHLSLKLIHLGYYERVAESAAQYAERLLKLHAASLTQKPAEIAKSLVYSYKDHGFVIDKAEAEGIFSTKVVKTDSEEYKLGNNIYLALMVVSKLARAMGHYFYFIGSSDSDPHFRKSG